MGGRQANTERRWRSPNQQRKKIPRKRSKALRGGGIQTAVKRDTVHQMEEVEIILGTDTGKDLQTVIDRNLRHQIEVENLHCLSDTGGDHHLLKDTEGNPPPWKERERNRLRKIDTGGSHQRDSETLLQRDTILRDTILRDTIDQNLLQRDTIGQNRLLTRGEQLIISKCVSSNSMFYQFTSPSIAKCSNIWKYVVCKYSNIAIFTNIANIQEQAKFSLS